MFCYSWLNYLKTMGCSNCATNLFILRSPQNILNIRCLEGCLISNPVARIELASFCNCSSFELDWHSDLRIGLRGVKLIVDWATCSTRLSQDPSIMTSCRLNKARAGIGTHQLLVSISIHQVLIGCCRLTDSDRPRCL